jgi:hypothetical protein
MIVFLSILVVLFAGGMVWYKGLYRSEVFVTKSLSKDNNLLRNMVSLNEYDIATLKKELADTKAELEQYKNHESETAKVIKPIGKKVTVSTDGAGMGAKASFEVFGLNTELVNDPHNVRYTFWYKGNRYLGYEVVDSKILAYPLSKPVITEAGKNVETFLEF